MTEQQIQRVSGHYCGQVQPHAAHTWETPPIYGSATPVSQHQCAGLAAQLPDISARVRELAATYQRLSGDTTVERGRIYRGVADDLRALLDRPNGGE